MPDAITTKPMRSQRQWRFLFANGMPFARRWARETPGGRGARYRKLPIKVRKKVAIKAPNYGARAGQTIAGRLVRGGDGRFSSSGSASSSATPPKNAAGAGRARGRKPAKPAKTEQQRAQEAEQRRQERQTERTRQQRDTRDAVLASLQIDPGAAEALVMLSNGEQPQAAALARMGAVEAGLVEQARDGSYRLTASGRQLLNAAERGDRGQAGDIISRSRDRLAERTDRQQARDRARAERQQASSGGSGGGKKKPEKKLPMPRSNRRPQRAQPSGGAGAAGAAGGGKPEQPAQPRDEPPAVDPELARLAERLSDGTPLDASEQQTLIRNGLARLVKGELVLTAAGQRATTKKEATHERLDAETRRRSAAQRGGIGALVRERLSPRHDRAQSADADRQAGRTARPGTATERTKAIAPTRTTDAGHTGVMVALFPDQTAAKAVAATDGVTEPVDQLHLTLAFLGDSTEQPLATNKEKVISAIADWAQQHGQPLKGTINGLGRFFHSERDDTNAVYVSPDVPGLPELRQSLVEQIEASGFDYSHDHGFTPHITVAYVPIDAPTPPIRVETPVTFDRVTLAWGDEHYDFTMGMPASKAFHVYKDRRGQYRWVTYSSNAYRDRDQEIVSTKALTNDCARADKDGQYGPLRWWHVGGPTGPGWDLGTCDFNAMHGRVLVESGTFKSAAIGQAIARAAPGLQVSIGFTHAPSEPDRDGVFHHIRRFERSLVPSGRAANPFTRLIVKETHMDQEKEAALKATLGDEVAAVVLSGAETVQKEADALGTAYKSTDPWMAVAMAIKSAMAADAAPAQPAAEVEPVAEKAPPPEMVEAEAEAKAPMDEMVAEAVEVEGEDPGEMSYDEFVSEIRRVVREELAAELKAQIGPLAAGLDIEKKVSSAVQNLMQPYQAQKDDEAAQLKATIAQQQAALKEAEQRLADLEGDIPPAFKAIGGYRPSQAHDNIVTKEIAAQLGEPLDPADDPNNPFGEIVSKLFGPPPASLNGH